MRLCFHRRWFVCLFINNLTKKLIKMGMSTSIIGFMSDESEQYKKHSKVLIACIEANIEKLPKETAKFFGEETPMKHLLEETLEVEITKYEYN